MSEQLDVLLDVASRLEWAQGRKSALQLRDIHNLIASVTDLNWDYIREWTSSLGLGDFLREVTK